jgi:hypothetical protein
MNDIYINDINLKNSNKLFPRTTKNYYWHFVDGLKLVFSYRTLIAIDRLVSVNNWSRTTARHLFWYSGSDKDHPRVDNFNEQAREILKNAGLLKERNPFRSVAAISSIFALISNQDNEEQIRKTNNQRKRFYETQPGIIFPDDWDSLATADQKKRLDMCDYVGLDKSSEILNSSTSKTI